MGIAARIVAVAHRLRNSIAAINNLVSEICGVGGIPKLKYISARVTCFGFPYLRRGGLGPTDKQKNRYPTNWKSQ